MKVDDWTAAEWGAFGQVGALVVALVAGVLVWRQVRQGAQAREDQTRPYVIVDFEFRDWEVLIAIRNIGTSPALDVKVAFDQPLRSPIDLDPDELAVFAEGIPMLAPGRTIAIPFGHGPKFSRMGSTSPFGTRPRSRIRQRRKSADATTIPRSSWT